MKMYNTSKPLSFKDRLRLLAEAAGFRPHCGGSGGSPPGGSFYNWRKSPLFLEVRWSGYIRRIVLVNGNGCSAWRADCVVADRCFVPFDGEEAFWSFFRELLEKSNAGVWIPGLREPVDAKALEVRC